METLVGLFLPLVGSIGKPFSADMSTLSSGFNQIQKLGFKMWYMDFKGSTNIIAHDLALLLVRLMPVHWRNMA